MRRAALDYEHHAGQLHRVHRRCVWFDKLCPENEVIRSVEKALDLSWPLSFIKHHSAPAARPHTRWLVRLGWISWVMVGGSGERFNTAVTVTCTVGLVIVLQRMRALRREVDTLAELVRGHETSLQWLSQRMETPVIRVSFWVFTLTLPILTLCPSSCSARPFTSPGRGRRLGIRLQARGCPCRRR